METELLKSRISIHSFIADKPNISYNEFKVYEKDNNYYIYFEYTADVKGKTVKDREIESFYNNKWTTMSNNFTDDDFNKFLSECKEVNFKLPKVTIRQL